VSDELPVTCPACGNRFEPFLRFQVGRRPWPWWNLLCLFLALICWACKEIVGYEGARGYELLPKFRAHPDTTGGRR
jgi:hypothetical protein